MPIQLPLALKLSDDATFDNFYVGDNAQVVHYLKQIPQGSVESNVYIYGFGGVGVSHLLQACCYAVNQQGKTAAYLPLAKENFSPAILEDMEELALICIDNIEVIAGESEWEEALFHCYNRIQNTHTRLVVGAHIPLNQIHWKLADLNSRLSACITFQLKSLSDEQKIIALQQRSKARGLELSFEVGLYLLNHYPRDMHVLFATLEKLDRASLIAQRRLTIPFVREVLSVPHLSDA